MNQVESSQDTATNKDNELRDAAQRKREFNKRRLLNAVQPTSGGYTRAREYHRKIDFPLQHCEFQKWMKYDSLPIERACFIMLGYEPPPLAWLRFEPQPFQSAPAPTWEEPPGYRDVLDSLRTSIARGKVSTMRITEFTYETEHIGWQELALWMRAKKYEISSGFEEAVATMGPIALMALAQSSDPIKRATLAPADTVAPVPETEAAAGTRDTHATPKWTLTKPKRFQGYTEPLHLLLESAYIAGKSKPTARDVLQTWSKNQPSHIAKVIPGESLDYYLDKGGTKSANLKAIAASIRGMTGKS